MINGVEGSPVEQLARDSPSAGTLCFCYLHLKALCISAGQAVGKPFGRLQCAVAALSFRLDPSQSTMDSALEILNRVGINERRSTSGQAAVPRLHPPYFRSSRHRVRLSDCGI